MFNLWLNYPMSKAVALLTSMKRNHRLMGHVLVIGPLAFCVLWDTKEVAKGE